MANETELIIARRATKSEYELGLASAVQRALLPVGGPSCSKLSTHAANRMSGTVGGDFYDFIKLEDGRIAVVIGDVLGHGVHSALIMALLVGSIRRFAQADPRPRRVVAETDRALNALGRTTEHVFTASVFYSIIDPVAGEMSYTNAAHPVPLVCRLESCRLAKLEPNAPLLGIDSDVAIEEDCFAFGEADRVVLYTDGITEAPNSGGDPFGWENLVALVGRGVDLDPREVTDSIFEEVDRHTGDAPGQDDQSVIVMDFLEKKHASS
jgi:serine phosphatase RsbU (regulator of sigma subunit)